MMNNNDYEQFNQIVSENEMTELGSTELAQRLEQAEAAANQLFGIIGLLAARQGGRLEFTNQEWNGKLPYKTVVYGEDLATDMVVIEFHE